MTTNIALGIQSDGIAMDDHTIDVGSDGRRPVGDGFGRIVERRKGKMECGLGRLVEIDQVVISHCECRVKWASAAGARATPTFRGFRTSGLFMHLAPFKLRHWFIFSV